MKSLKNIHFIPDLLFLLWVVSLLFFTSTLQAQKNEISIPLGLEKIPGNKNKYDNQYEVQRPKITLALSGGGARGLAQIGVLKVIEKYGIPVDGIAGTSIGSVIGALYSTGYTSSEIEKFAYETNWDDIIYDNPERKQLFLGQKEERSRYVIQLRLKDFSIDIPNAITSGQKFTTLMTDLLFRAPYPPVNNFNDLHIPLKIVTTDLIEGKKIILEKGSLINAVRASMAIPLLFTPVKQGKYLLVDGGLLQNLPVNEARSFHHDLVIAVNTCSELRDISSLHTPWEVADQVTTIMQKNIVKNQFEQADIQIQPDLKNISNTDFEQINTIINNGETAAEKAMIQLKSLLSRKMKLTDQDTSYFIKNILFKGCNRLSPEDMLKRIDLSSDTKLKKSDIIWAGQSLYQAGNLELIEARVDTSDSLLTFNIKENPFIKKVIFHNNTVFTSPQLRDSLNLHLFCVLNNQDFRNGIKKILSMYHKKNLSAAKIDSINITHGILNIFIDEGRIEKIIISGNQHTRDYVIKRELPFKKGDIFNISAIKEGITNIYSTGFFKYVRIKDNQFQKNNHLIINLKERTNRLLQFGFRFDMMRRSQSILQLVEENIFGIGGKGSITGLIGYRDQMIKTRLWSSRLLNSLLTYNLQLFLESRRYYFYENLSKTGEYRIENTGASLELGRQMGRLGTVSLNFTTEKTDIRSIKGTGTPQDKYVLSTITLQSEVDKRNRMPFPSKGEYHILKYTFAGDFIASDIAFVKLYSSMEAYYPFSSIINFHPRISWGFADLTTPFVKKYRLGGLDSFMGLPDEALTGKQFICLNTELRIQLPWSDYLEWFISLHYDLGGIWNKYTNLNLKDFIQGTGAIISLNTPVGPIQFGYGSMDKGKDRFYLSAGYKF
ncbi:MAG: BamA/TamA family outer membrane protein [bacterium]